jgi:hypothetical protein
MYLDDPMAGAVNVHGWAYDQQFYGYFTLSGPNGLAKRTATQNWAAGGTGPTWTVDAVLGKYCITGWRYSTSTKSYYIVGEPCESVE